MLNIVLLCQFGASTGMLAKKIEDAAKERNIDAVVNAYGVSRVEDVLPIADIILLGPQMRFRLSEFEKEYADFNVPFLLIDTVDYGMMNGKKVFNEIIKKLENYNGEY